MIRIGILIKEVTEPADPFCHIKTQWEGIVWEDQESGTYWTLHLELV